MIISEIEKLPKERKIFRFIGDVFVEHSISEVSRALNERKDQVLFYLK